MTDKKIAIILHDLRMGGAENIMLQLAAALSKEDVDVDLLLAHVQGPLLGRVPAKVRVVDLNVNDPLAMLRKVTEYLRANRPTALISPFEVTSVVAILAKWLAASRTRIVVRLSVALSRHKRVWFKKMLERITVSLLYRFANAIVAVSKGVARDFSSYSGIPESRLTVIYNPIISEQFVHDKNETATHPLLEHALQQPIILGVGRLTEQKDFHSLIRAFNRVEKSRRARLIILGEGEDRPSLEKLISELHIQDMVDLPGIVLNPLTFMKKASVFVLSSRWEGLPGALIQALACDCAVVSTDCPSGPFEILDAGRYGHLVPVGNVESMASAIEEVLDGDHRIPPQTWMNQYDVNKVVTQYKNVLGISSHE